MSLLAAEIAVLCMLLGAVGGSFTATAVLRGLQRRQVISGRSACDACGISLTYTESLPVLSYLVRRGACQTCRSPIDPLHFAGEAAGCLLGLSIAMISLIAPTDAVTVVGLMGLGFSLLALSLVDCRTQRIPDALTGLVLLCGLLLMTRTSLQDLGVHLAWAGAVFIALILVSWASAAFRGEPGLGFGDVKLLSALAVWLGPVTPSALVLACALALLARVVACRFTGRAPFGHWIPLAAWIVGLGAEGHLWPV